MAAIVIVLASPLIGFGLQRWSLLGPPRSLVALERWLPVPLAALSAAAGLIHLGVMPDHLAEDTVTGLFFVVAAVLQLGWAAAFVRRPGRPLAGFALVVNVAIVGAWLMTRTVGLPFGAHPFVPEPIGVSDGFATAAELLIVAGTAAMVLPSFRSRVAERRFAVAAADLTTVMALVAIGLTSSFALADIAVTGGHR